MRPFVAFQVFFSLKSLMKQFFVKIFFALHCLGNSIVDSSVCFAIYYFQKKSHKMVRLKFIRFRLSDNVL